jgi:hypothetical protein
MEDIFQTPTAHRTLEGQVCDLLIERTCPRLVAADTDRLGKLPARMDLGRLYGIVQG